MEFLLGLFMPFFGTTLGAATVFFLKGGLHEGVQRALLGFAAGVMMAASVWSLLLPAAELAAGPGWVPCLTGFLAGVAFLLGVERLADTGGLLAFAVTLHNVPEGMAVGVALAGMGSGLSAASALALSFGIAVQNIPEGAVISLPLGAGGMKKARAFGRGVLSGAVEPVASIFTAALVSFVRPVLPYILSFAAGAMIYVVVEELIPQAQSGALTKSATLGAALGFAVMMTLDIALG
ncbi:MAG: ZIP family metal transporter [Eubacteriales bacterium]|nr:ZIP family metal transporter [Eubacteriales bacterium]